MYANFCYHLAGELPDLCVDHEKITFKRLLLNKCQEEFERGAREQAEANRVEEEGEIKCSEVEREEKKTQARRRMLGNIRLIGELYKKKMLTERIMHECIQKLLGQDLSPDEEDIEALCKLMSTIGEMIDHPKAKEHMDAYFDEMTKFSNNMKLSARVRFMLKDSIDLRKNKWQQRRKIDGPKKIEEVHRDAAQERQQASRLARGSGIISSARRGQPIDYGSRESTMLSSPNAQMGGFRGLPPHVRGYGAQDVRLEERNRYESRVLSVPLPQRPIDDNPITLGPQGGLGRGMSMRGQSLVSSVPLADISPSSGDSRILTAGPNGYSSVSEGAPYNSYNSREEFRPRYITERFTGPFANDHSNSQERNMHIENRDLRNADCSFKRSFATSPATRLQGSSVVRQNVPSEKLWPEELLREKSIAAIREFYSPSRGLVAPAGHPLGRGRGGRMNQTQQGEMVEMRRMIEQLAREVQNLQRKERAEAQMKVPEGNRKPSDLPEGDSEEDIQEVFEENPFNGPDSRSNLNVVDWNNSWEAIRNEMRIIRISNLEGAYQYALRAEERVSRLGRHKNPLNRTTTTANIRNSGAGQGVRSDSTSVRGYKNATIIGRTIVRTIGNNGADKAKEIAKNGGVGRFGSNTKRAHNISILHYYSCGERGHVSYACPQVNLVEGDSEEEEYDLPLYDQYQEDEEEAQPKLPGSGLIPSDAFILAQDAFVAQAKWVYCLVYLEERNQECVDDFCLWSFVNANKYTCLGSIGRTPMESGMD
ncbi:hypothetical protein HHK36_032429 [Tetracentron sinense]|uniref:MIF4G domain-containing protein n=1 Tax=Tetracentron sinense TaxID=13715 RepID=A0A834Y5I3_TETSI|nr:hypothetical protein HHK36_032429 [Tetracentron sinense]